MIYTNINLSDNTRTFTYMVGFEDITDPTYNETTDIKYKTDKFTHSLLIKSDKLNISKRKDNIWETNINIDNYDDLNIDTKFSKIYIYFPDYSIDTFSTGTYYAIGVNLFINNSNINLGTFIVNRTETLASNTINNYSNNYQEYISFDIINPLNIIYGKEWEDFRKNIINNNYYDWGCSLNIYMYPVIENDGVYIIKDKYDGGYNSINLYESNNYLNLILSHNLNDIDNNDPELYLHINYNDNFNDLKSYIYSIYGIDNIKLYYNLFIKDKNNVYMGPIEFESLDISDITVPLSALSVDSWDGYKEGLSIIASASIVDENNKEIIFLKSYELPLTQEIYCYLIKSNNNFPKNINLNNINMNQLNINVVNKTEQKIIKLDKPNDSKSNIIQPVFFKARDLANIIIHPEVTEYISINLDSYKALVKTFIIQIEGCKFVESGRSSAGVIFKIIGNNLPKETESGTYYILNEDYSLITNGKYTYEY